MLTLFFNYLIFQANTKRLQPVSGLLAALLVKDKELQHLANRAFITYLRSIHIQQDKEVFDVMKLPIEEFSASLGLPMTPKIRFLKRKTKGKNMLGESSLHLQEENYDEEDTLELRREVSVSNNIEEDKVETPHEEQGKATGVTDVVYVIFFSCFYHNSVNYKLCLNALCYVGN